MTPGVAIIGCGLMGGSFALALREAGAVAQVAGYSARASTRAQALTRGVIDQDCASVAEAVAGADLVLVGAAGIGGSTDASRIRTAVARIAAQAGDGSGAGDIRILEKDAIAIGFAVNQRAILLPITIQLAEELLEVSVIHHRISITEPFAHNHTGV